MNEPKITVKDGVMTIVCDLSGEGERSASGKSVVLSSTRGNLKVGEYTVGLNVYRKG